MKHQHAKLSFTIELPDLDALVQRDVDRFIVAYRAEPPADDASRTLKAAIKAGWVQAPAMSVDMVDNLAPRVVRWAASKVDALYAEATTIPPE